MLGVKLRNQARDMQTYVQRAEHTRHAIPLLVRYSKRALIGTVVNASDQVCISVLIEPTGRRVQGMLLIAEHKAPFEVLLIFAGGHT